MPFGYLYSRIENYSIFVINLLIFTERQINVIVKKFTIDEYFGEIFLLLLFTEDVITLSKYYRC